MPIGWAIAGATLLGAGTSLASGMTQADAIGDAAKSTKDASAYAADLAHEEYLQGRQDIAPWRKTGETALRQLAHLMGLPETPETPETDAYGGVPAGQVLINGELHPLYNYRGQNYYSLRAGNYSAPGWKQMEDELRNRAKAIPGAVVTRMGGQTRLLVPAPEQEAGGTAIPEQEYWGEAGQLTRPFEFGETDPSYQWRFNQGREALEQSAAARGGYFSGQTGMDLEQYGQNMASQEYQDEFNRHLSEQQNLYNMLSGLSGTGQTAATTTAGLGANYAATAGGATMTGATNAANLQSDAARAMASGYMGAGNQAMSGVGTWLNYQQMQDLLKRIPVTGNLPGPG